MSEPVTKAEALGMVTRFIEKPGVIDLPELIELSKWQTKLTLWLLKENAMKQTPADLKQQQGE